jgi:5-formyltetrahydrofolate cyclo-ligase
VDGVPETSPLSQENLFAWRRQQRERLLAQRLTLSAEERQSRAERLLPVLEAVIGQAPEPIVSFYWPFRAEFDLRRWMEERLTAGWRPALPIVVEKGKPLAFRLWRPGCRMERGIWNIPVPAEGPYVRPDVVIAPLVGWDPARYRLGYGGGYFDRTLAALSPRPKVIGIGLSSARLDSIHPQTWDIPMNVIVTEDGQKA